MDYYPIETLPFPVRPKDTVYFVFDSDDGPAIESDYVDTVGVDDEKRLIVCCGEYYEDKVGLKDRCFLTRDDAERYIEDSSAFTDAYGTTDLWPDDIPYRPGIDVYTYDDDPPGIFGSACYIVYFTEEGEVFVVDDYCRESCVVGSSLDPCFLTFEEAYAHMHEHLQAQ